MIKKRVMPSVLFLFLLLMAGCETVKGTVQGAAQGAAQGVKKDWQTALKTDQWIRDNLW